MDQNVAVVLDGITVQHAGELFFDSRSTKDDRPNCRDTYLASLEDFAFALVFGTALAVSKKLRKVGDDKPGGALLSELPEDLVLDIDDNRYPKNPRQMLEAGEDRDLLELCMKRLPDCVQTDRDIWEQFMIREARHHLGEDPTLFRNDIEPDQYIFEVDEKGLHYHMRDREAEDWIPPTVVSNLASIISPLSNAMDKQFRAMEEFVRCTILTHIQIFLWYHRAAAASLSVPELLFLPYPTRAPLMPNLPPSDFKRIKKLVLPYVLQKALHGPNRRQEVLEELKELRGKPFAEEIRSDLLRYLRTKDPRVVQEIAEKIDRKSREAGGENTQTLRTGISTANLDSRADYSAGVGETTESWAGYYQLVRAPLGPDAAEIEAKLGRLFPELRRR